MYYRIFKFRVLSASWGHHYWKTCQQRLKRPRKVKKVPRVSTAIWLYISMELPECCRFPKHWIYKSVKKRWEGGHNPTPPDSFSLAFTHDEVEVEPKLFPLAWRLYWVFDSRALEDLMGNVNHGICPSGEKGRGDKAERFYQDSNPQNAALNKNETDKARRSHHRICNSRKKKTGALQWNIRCWRMWPCASVEFK